MRQNKLKENSLTWLHTSSDLWDLKYQALTVTSADRLLNLISF